VMGKRSDMVIQLLGAGNRAELVHRDNLVLVGTQEEASHELG